LPGVDLALERVGPRAVEVDLLVGALVHDLEAVPHDARSRLPFGRFVRLHVHDDERVGVIEHLHDGSFAR